MIRTENNIFYMTLGEGCYIARVDDGKLKHVWFGKRVEPEDDLTVLSGTSVSELSSEFFVDSGIADQAAGACETDFKPDTVVDTANGKALSVDFKFSGFIVESEKAKADGLPTLRGGKTLIVTLTDGALGLTSDIYYTPYSRGGITRRVTVKNNGKRTLRLRVPSGAVRLAGEYTASSIGSGEPINYMGLTGSRGDAYGFCLCYGGSAVMASDNDGGITDFISEVDENVILAAGESITLPELLAVYSDNGRSGAARVFHDIIREFAVPERYFGTRRPIALYCPFGDGQNAEECAAVAPELGADAFVMPYDLRDDKSLKAAADTCKKSGIKPGVKIMSKTKLDLADPKTVDKLYAAVACVVEKYGVEYVSLSDVCKAGQSLSYTLGAYRLFERISSNHPEVITECAADLGSLCYSPIAEVNEKSIASENPLMLCLPPCVYAARVTDKKKVSLKTRFDIASFGCLGYALDPRALTEDMRRAVRAQVYSYQDDAKLIMNGDLYILGGGAGFAAVSKDKSKAYAVVLGGAKDRIAFTGLDEHNLYAVRELDKTFSGAALVGYGIAVPDYVGAGETLSFHFSQVADYE